ncbi:MAG TPA: DUF6776 family protein [Acidiferrobacter sp.]|nr:DUF6776 family protein [Acidiferrobacter sp.]
MPNRIGDLVVKRRVSPLRHYGLVAVAVAVVILGGIGLFRHGERVAGFNVVAAARYRVQALAHISRLRQQVAHLTAELAVSKRSLETDEAAYAALSAALKRSDQSIMGLHEKLGFYHVILGAANKGAGLTIDQFHITPGAHAWHYQLALVQSFAFRHWVYASMRFTVQGEEAGRSSEFSYPSLVQAPLTVHFRYFDNVQGRLVLPAGFVPRQLVVQVVAGGHVTKQTYDWPAGPSVSHK